jgi:hypothetical protein
MRLEGINAQGNAGTRGSRLRGSALRVTFSKFNLSATILPMPKIMPRALKPPAEFVAPFG